MWQVRDISQATHGNDLKLRVRWQKLLRTKNYPDTHGNYPNTGGAVSCIHGNNSRVEVHVLGRLRTPKCNISFGCGGSVAG